MLSAQLYPADSGAIVVMAHGFLSEKTSDGRFITIAHALNQAGYAALAFDCTGCGDNEPAVARPADLDDDLHAAIAFARGSGYSRIALHGHSLGSLICLRCADREIVTMALTGALTGRMDYRWEDLYSPQQLRDLDTHGLFSVVDRTGRPRVVGKELIAVFGAIDQRTLVGGLNCPVLLIHGNDPTDQEERELLARSRRALPLLPAGSRLEVIDGASHGLRGHMDQVTALLVDWYRRMMPPR